MLVTSSICKSNTAHDVERERPLPRTAGLIATQTQLHTARADRSRTLAYFIVRRPRGLIAAALQYGHVSTRVTLNYSGIADTTWMEDLAVERLELVLEQADRDWARRRGARCYRAACPRGE
jgi:hypothetical protein